LLQKTPLNRLLAKVEYNCVIAWMLSDSSSYFNGAIITVDGGKTGW
jgi:NAD(P)-dependent dehydrogenase (short-subunit alcohol dehydrogenase family)